MRLHLFFSLLFLLQTSFLLSAAPPHPSYSGFITIKAFPLEKQICERQRDLTTAPVHIAGTVATSSNYDKVRLAVVLDEDTMDTLTIDIDLTYENDSASYDFVYDLEANLINHDFILYGLSNDEIVVEWKAPKVVAGDIFLINGQSNAQAYLSPMDEDIVEFTRSYFNGTWDYIDHSYPGRWGAHLANIMSQSLGYPIAIFNYADGAQPISYFQKDETDSLAGNYGSMLIRFAESGVEPMLALWFHGEANGWDEDPQYYTNYLALHNSWKTSFGIEASFIFQVRHLGCAHPYPYVLEDQRRLSADFEDIMTMSTTNADQDSCHYRWEDGYKALALRMSKLINKRIYNEVITQDDYAPNVNHVYLYNDSTLAVTFIDSLCTLSIIGDPSNEFKLEETNIGINSLTTINDTLFVSLDSIAEIDQHFSYYSHPGPFANWVVTNTGVGMLEFYNFLIEEYIPPPPDTTTSTSTTVSSGKSTGTTNLKSTLPIRISPNPVKDICRLSWLKKLDADVLIYDDLGRVLSTKHLAGKTQTNISLENFPKGTYHVIVKSKDKIGIGRVVKI